VTNQQLKKSALRLYPVALNGFRTILNPLLAIGFSFVVVRYFSKELWGNFVEYMLFFFIASIVTSWGNKTYLMRAFSQNPKNIIIDWQEFFLARVWLCGIFVIPILFLYPCHLIVYLILWLLSSFIYNSFLVIIYYNRDYIKSISIEVVGFVILVAQLYFLNDRINLDVLIRSYAISIVIKVMMSIIYYHRFIHFKEVKFNFNVLKLGLPFFLLAISGFLQSKIDVYAFNIFYDGKLLGEYQIISGFFIFSQSLVTVIMFPYLKNIYRMQNKTILKIKKTTITYGILINLTITIFIYYILLLLFDIKLTLTQAIIGFFVGLPPYIYSMHVFYLFKQKMERKVVQISIYCLSLNFVLSLVLLALDFDITGVLLANAAAQILGMYYYLNIKINA